MNVPPHETLFAAVLLLACAPAEGGDSADSVGGGGTRSGGSSADGVGGNASSGGAVSAPSGGSLANSSALGLAGNGGGGDLTTGGTRASNTLGRGGMSGGQGGTASGTSTTDTQGKRGIAANIAPGVAFSPAVSWWYNWANKSTGANVGLEFVPMIWNQVTVNSALPATAQYVLGFNEPNFFAQANLSAASAASHWPALEATAKTAGVAIVGPAMNYCGPASECHDTDPYQYLKDFFAACPGCKVDYIAVHWYNCDLPSLRDYLEPGGNLPGFEQFGKPIWLTEFSCDPTATVAEQEAYMRAAIPYLESNPKVFRYSWFSAGPIPNAQLLKSDGTPTALGKVYIDLPRAK